MLHATSLQEKVPRMCTRYALPGYPFVALLLILEGTVLCCLISTSAAHDGQEQFLKRPSYLYRVNEVVSDSVVAAFIAGGTAGAVSRTIVSPLERLKILFQIQSAGRHEYKLSIGKALIKMGKDEGWRGFLRGNGTNCIRIVPYSAVQFGSYSCYKKVRWLDRFLICDRHRFKLIMLAPAFGTVS